MTEAQLLDIQDLCVTFHVHGADLRAVRNVNFSMKQGEVVALVGESGSGKSTIGLSIMRLLEQTKSLQVSGAATFHRKAHSPVDLMTCSDRQMLDIRGNDIAMIFQEPMSSLNPIFQVGGQIAEAIRVHQKVSRAEAMKRALEMLTLLGIPNPEKCLTSYPHQISGGMRQRVMIAMGLACEPSLLIADEPTTALDVTIQAQIVEHLKQLRERTGMSILFITHDLGLVAEIADRVLVLYAGQVVELSDVRSLFDAPLMPYTRALMRSMPQRGCSSIPDYRIEAIPGGVPNPIAFPPGCAFHPRCQFVDAGNCDTHAPDLEDAEDGHKVRCLRWQAIREGAA